MPTVVDGFYDSEYDLPCEFTLLEDGLYCVPRRDTRGFLKGYADSKCQTRLSQAEEACQKTNLPRYAAGVCSAPEVVFESKQGTGDVPAFDLSHRHQTGADGFPVDQNSASAAVARVAADFSPH